MILSHLLSIFINHKIYSLFSLYKFARKVLCFPISTVLFKWGFFQFFKRMLIEIILDIAQVSQIYP